MLLGRVRVLIAVHAHTDRNEVITFYYGPTLLRKQLPEEYDASYILCVPNSGVYRDTAWGKE